MAGNDRLIGELKEAVSTLKDLVSKLEDRLDTVESQRDKAIGGYKVLMIVGASVSSVFGMVGALLVNWLKNNPIVEAAKQVAGL